MNIDITERKQAEAERDELLRRLAVARDTAEEASKAKSEFLANMSHELRTPMTAILGVVELMMRHCEDDRQRQQLAVIRRNGEHLTTILNDILDLSRIEAGRLELVRETFSPVTLVEEVRTLMQVRAQEKHLPLIVRYRGALPAHIESDRTRVRQIMVNLVGNAIKFTPAGHVMVEAGMVERGGRSRLQVRVVDTGVGMDPEQVERLFAPFEQADSSVQRQFGGSGLGLGISRRLVDMLGGDIEVETAPGEGSTFTLRLPVGDIEDEPWFVPGQADRIVEEVAPPRPGLDQRLEGCRVLITDDQAEVRAILRDLISAAGAEVEEAQDGLQALTALQTNGGSRIDAVLLDLQMPVMDGYDTVRRLRARGDTRPVIAVTASAMRGDRERALAAGCDDHFAKPIDVDALLGALVRLCGRDAEPAGRDAEPAGREAEPARRDADPATGHAPRCRVLVVDDDRDVRDLLGEVLADLDCETHLAGDAAGAQRLLDDGLRPHLALLDLSLPDLSGLPLVQALREHPGMAGTRLVALSGHSDPEVIRQVRDAGCDAYHVKPIDLMALEDEVERATPGPGTRADPDRVSS